MAIALCASTAKASRLTVPDDVSTVQAALDTRVDTVLVRAGIHDESPTASNGVVLLGIAGEPGVERPTISGLFYNADYAASDVLIVRGLAFSGHVRMVTAGVCSNIFEDCTFLGVITVSSDPTTSISFSRCRIVGDASLQAYSVVDSCVVEGHLTIAWPDADMSVTNCEFHGDGTRAAIYGSVMSAVISRNVISGYGVGISITTDGDARIEENTVRDCASSGIGFSGSSGHVVGNRVERCGGYGGVYTPSGSLSVMNNMIVDCRGIGLYVGCDGDTKVIGNIVLRNGLDGIEIDGYPSGSDEIRNNTSALNRGSGYRFQIGSYYAPLMFTHNLGFGNERHGIDCAGSDAPNLHCNAWFGNALGDALGLTPSSDDLTLNPLLCDPANGDFHPSSVSPLVQSSACGLIGALGVGCVAPGVIQDAFHLARIGPNPASGPVTIEFDMPRAASVEIDVFDVQGRLVASPARGNWPAGKHVVSWSATAGGVRPRPGLYLVRYRFPGGQEQRRLVRTP